MMRWNRGDDMARSDKQLNNETKYVNNMKKLSEAYKYRVEFASRFKLKMEKTKGYMEIGDPSAVSSANGGTGEDGATGGGTFTGDMPTIDNYAGPDAYHDPRFGNLLYQNGLRAKLKGTDQWNAAILKAGEEVGVNPVLIKCLMAVESGGKHSSTPNFVGCVGLMQVKVAEWSGKADVGRLKNDPEYNILIGTKHIKTKIDYLKTLRKKSMKYDSVFKIKVDVHGVSWLYNGYHVPSSTNSSNKWTNGLMYADQIVAMYGGFGLKGTDSAELKPAANASTATASAAPTGGGGNASAVAASTPTVSSMTMKAMAEEEVTPALSELNIDNGNQLEYMPPMTIDVPIGRIKYGKFVAPVTPRNGYVEILRHNAFETKYKDYRRLDERFVHVAGPQENLYLNEAATAFEYLLLKLKWKKLKIIQGFQPKYDNNTYSTHSAGIAMDIEVANIFEALEVADTAWEIGFRAVAIGGDRLNTTQKGFVHIDCGPKSFWSYAHHDVYKGPGTFDIQW